ncbi:CheR family methyltransferase [Haloferula sargassicola]|uniref:CheR family methyltransferase n=1 Tax=Haloferula sargassicola TaxID=490096 RepID=UPI0033654E5D
MDEPADDHPRFRHIRFAGTRAVPVALSGEIGNTPAKCSQLSPPPAEEIEDYPMEQVAFVRRILRMAGIRAEGYRITPLVRRIPACLRALRARDMDSADRIAANDPNRLQIGVNALLIGTTSFFRDTTVFHELDQRIVPELLTRCAKPQVWSAACSDGSELSSVAMLFAKHGGLDRTRFLGTDCRPSAIGRAIEGSYPVEAADLFPADLRERFLRRDDKHCRLQPVISTRLEWKLADLLAETEGTGWNLILCRNLAIYLSPHQARQLWLQLHASLAPGGYLVVGKAEKPEIDGLHRASSCIYRKDAS